MLWWLSFVDPAKPEGKRFLGVVITEANDFLQATQKLHATGVNPGGEVLGSPLPEWAIAVCKPYLDRLLTEAEAEEVNDLGEAYMSARH